MTTGHAEISLAKQNAVEEAHALGAACRTAPDHGLSVAIRTPTVWVKEAGASGSMRVAGGVGGTGVEPVTSTV